jgi:hypothetical protein
MMVSKSEIYAKAAEVIVRDGKHTGTFFGAKEAPQGGPLTGEYHPDLPDRTPGDIMRAVRADGPVCAMGACARAEYELTGALGHHSVDEIWGEYTFETDVPYPGYSRSFKAIYMFNDDRLTTAEDVAVMLKRKAAGEL